MIQIVSVGMVFLFFVVGFVYRRWFMDKEGVERHEPCGERDLAQHERKTPRKEAVY